ncbi:MAG: hypothetical protein Q7T03_07800 [Deltaproteobacteria bacterium]|nr:hypothetical protein [Deltaproteobacteria bacterium]
MGNDRICFDRAKLNESNGDALYYQWDVGSLTGGAIVESEDACVEASQVPPSFVLSGLDAKNPQEVYDYVRHQPYYQMTACWKGQSQGIRDFYQIDRAYPKKINEEDWKRGNTSGSVFDDWRIDGASMVYALSEYPLNNAMSVWMQQALGGTRDFMCNDFGLTALYFKLTFSEEKRNIGRELLSRECYRRLDKKMKSTELNAELDPQLFAVFAELMQYESLDVSYRYQSGQESVAIGGEAALAFLAQEAIANGRGDTSNIAADVLLESARDNPAAIPHIARVLETTHADPYGLAALIFRGFQQESFPADPRMIPSVTAVLRKFAAKSSEPADPEKNALSYLARCGKEAISSLVGFVYQDDVKGPYADNFRIEAFKALATMNDPEAQQEIKNLVCMQYPLPATAYDGVGQKGLGLTKQFLKELAVSSNSQAHRTLLDLDGDEMLPQQLNFETLYYLGTINEDPETAYLIFETLWPTAVRTGLDVPSNSAKQTLVSLVRKYSDMFAQKFSGLSDVAQALVVEAWMVGWVPDTRLVPYAYTVVSDPKSKASPELLKKMEVQILEGFKNNQNAVLDRHAMATSLFPLSLRERLLLNVSLDTLWDVASNDSLELKLRVAAVKRTSHYSRDTIDDRLASFALNSNYPAALKKAAIDTLKVRVGLGVPFRENARLTLQRLAGPSEDVRTQARAALREVSKK